MGWYMGLLELIGTLSLIVLLNLYLFEKWFGPTWPGLSKPVILLHVFRDWLVYMLLFTGLVTLLEGILKLACSHSC